jgi:hypothetical protein
MLAGFQSCRFLAVGILKKPHVRVCSSRWQRIRTLPSHCRCLSYYPRYPGIFEELQRFMMRCVKECRTIWAPICKCTISALSHRFSIFWLILTFQLHSRQLYNNASSKKLCCTVVITERRLGWGSQSFPRPVRPTPLCNVWAAVSIVRAGESKG